MRIISCGLLLVGFLSLTMFIRSTKAFDHGESASAVLPVEDAKPEDAKPEDAKPEDAKPEDAKPEDAKPEETPVESTVPEIQVAKETIAPPSPVVLPVNAPDWIRDSRQHREGTTLVFPILIASINDQPIEDSEFNLQMREEVIKFLDENVFTSVRGKEIEALTADHIKKHWLDKEHRFESTIDLGNSKYQQIWLQISIDQKDQQLLKTWEAQHLSRVRGKDLGSLGVLVVLGMTVFSGGVGILARREQAKLKK